MLLRRVARPLLSAIFISGGVNQLLNPEGHQQAGQQVLDKAAPVLDKAGQRLPGQGTPSDQTWVMVDGGVKVGAGALLALGWAPRLAATALAASLIPTTLATHRFWEMQEGDERQAQQIHFFKNCGLLGGLLLAAVDTEGKPSLGWWAKRAARTAEKALSGASDTVEDVTSRASDVLDDVADRLPALSR